MKQTFEIPQGAISFEIDVNPVFTIPEPPVNQAPIASAGNDITITLPVNSIKLTGVASDPEGQPLTYLWRSIDKPATINDPSAAIVTISDLKEGVYTFELAVTDIHGAKGYDQTTVTVKPEVVIPPSSGNLTFENDFNQASDINTNQLGRGKQTTFQDRGVFMSEVRNGDQSISSGYRSEQQYTQKAANPTEGVWEWEAYYENWDQIRGKNGHSFQFHPSSSSGSAIWSLQNYNGKFNVVRSLNGANYHQPGTLKDVVQNKWYKFRLEAKWSTGSDGYFRLYIDGQLYYSYTGVTTTGGFYVKIGQNTWNPIPTRAVVYYDNFKVYTIKA